MARLLDLIPRTNTFLPTRDLFDTFFDDWDLPVAFRDDSAWMPAFDISETEKDYVVTAELPGIDAKDIDVTLTEGVLTVKGEKKHETEDKGKDYHRIERRYGSFHRSFRIPKMVKTENIDSSFKDGVLVLTLPKSEESETKKIEVK